MRRRHHLLAQTLGRWHRSNVCTRQTTMARSLRSASCLQPVQRLWYSFVLGASPCASFSLHALPNAAQEQPNAHYYAPFSAVLGYEPDYSHVPSGTQRAATKQRAAPAALPVAAKQIGLQGLWIRATIERGEFDKPRAVFCALSLDKLQDTLDSEAGGAAPFFATEVLATAIADDIEYVCGMKLFCDDHALASHVYCNTAINCSDPMEVQLYSATDSAVRSNWLVFSKASCSGCGRKRVSERRRKDQGCLGGSASGWVQFPLSKECAETGVAPRS
jgi:hypothetical protein